MAHGILFFQKLATPFSGRASPCITGSSSLKEGCSQDEVDHLFSSIALPNITYALSVYGDSESELTIPQQFLDRCFKGRYTSKKLEMGELLKVQDHRICRKVSSIPNHSLRAIFPETKITRYNFKE